MDLVAHTTVINSHGEFVPVEGICGVQECSRIILGARYGYNLSMILRRVNSFAELLLALVGLSTAPRVFGSYIIWATMDQGLLLFAA